MIACTFDGCDALLPNIEAAAVHLRDVHGCTKVKDAVVYHLSSMDEFQTLVEESAEHVRSGLFV